MFLYNGGQKCWDLSSDITKTSDPSPPTPNKVEFGAKWVKLTAFIGHWGRREEPKAEQKIVLRSRILRNYCWEGLSHTVPSSFVLHCRLPLLDALSTRKTVARFNWATELGCRL